MKRLVSILIMVILIVNITSCIQSSPSKKPIDQNKIDKKPQDNSDPYDSTITIKIAANISEKLLDKFLEDHPDVEIITYNTHGAKDLLNNDEAMKAYEFFDIKGEEPPDIFTLRFSSYSLENTLVEIEYAEPLDRYIETSPGFYDYFLPGALEASKFAGQTLILPLGWELEYLWYNKDIFDELSINYPAGDWDIDDLVENIMAVTRINEENPKENIAGMVVQFGDFMFYRYMILAMGGKLYKQEGNNYIPTVSTDPNTARALATIANLVDNNSLIFNESKYPSSLGAKVSSLTKLPKYPYDIWGQGRAVIASHNNTIRRDKSAKFTISDIRYPKGKNKEVVGLIEFDGLSIHKDSKNKELCWELMEYISSDYFQDKALEQSVDRDEYTYSINQFVPTSVFSLDKELSEYHKKTQQDLMESAGNTTTPDEYEYKILIEIMKAMQKVYGGQEYLEVILKQIDEYARENVF